MTDSTPLPRFDIRHEVIKAQLGDQRRNRRLADILAKMSRCPEASTPTVLGNPSELKAYYRLVGNRAVTDDPIFQAHFDRTKDRAAQLDTVVVAHDTTQFSFAIHDGEPTRALLPRISSKRQGFSWHASLAMSADPLKAPLGLIAGHAFVHNNDKLDAETRSYWNARDGVMENEQERWFNAVCQAQDRIEDHCRVIHVQDREGDEYRALVAMDTCDYHFIIRLVRGRNISTGPLRRDKGKLEEELAKVAWLPQTRQVTLSARTKADAKPGHPVRRGREATLRVRAARMTLRRPDSVPASGSPNTLEVNVIEVEETGAPAGQEPVRWLLVTNESIEDALAIWQVVDWYRARWMVEEFFKAVKTGTNYLKTQHRDASTLLNALSMKAVVAWHLLRMRHLGRAAPAMDALQVIDEVQLEVLKALKPKHIKKKATVGQVMAAVASLGGHLKHNGNPGWQTLGRGWRKFLEVEQGFRLAMAALK